MFSVHDWAEVHRLTVRGGNDPLAGEMYSEADFDVVDAVREVGADCGLPRRRSRWLG